MKDFVIVIISFLLVFPLAASGASVRFTSIIDGAVVPSNWLHPIIDWDESGETNKKYQLSIWTGDASLLLSITGNRYVFRDDSFKPFLTSRKIFFKIDPAGESNSGDTAGVIVDYLPFKDIVIYRLVEPLFNPGQDAFIETMNLGDGRQTALAELKNTCIGCHSYSGSAGLLNLKRGSDRRLVLGKSSAYGNVFQQFKLGEFSFISISPDGVTAAIVRNSRSMIDIKSNAAEPFDMTYSSGRIEIFNQSEGKILPLPGASDTNYVSDMPSWSPDGKNIVFCRYEANPGVNLLKPVRLFIVPYNNGKGGKAVPLLKKPPSDYCYFPKFSPNGKFVSFVSGNASKGYFARKSSSIWLYSLLSGDLKKLSLNKPGTMNSWHAWSSDSRWMVFSTKRDRDELTTLYMAKIDPDGSGHPPVKIAFDNDYKVNLPFLVPEGKLPDFGKDLPKFIDAIMH